MHIQVNRLWKERRERERKRKKERERERERERRTGKSEQGSLLRLGSDDMWLRGTARHDR
jgi:hypothetical protein